MELITEEVTDGVILNLKVISKLTVNDGEKNFLKRLYFGSGQPTICNVGWIPRWMLGESRNRTLSFVEKTYSSCFNLIEMYSGSNFLDCDNTRQDDVTLYQKGKAGQILAVLSSLVKELEASTLGLCYLLKAYSVDSNFVARLEILRSKAQRSILATVRTVEQTSKKIGIAQPLFLSGETERS